MSPAFASAAAPHNTSGRDAAPVFSGPLSMQAGSAVPSTARAPRGGMIFVVLGIATVVAVMLILVLWSVVTR